jgi:hypothetical protein
VLCLIGKVRYRKDIVSHLSGIHWKALNKQHRNDYSKAIEEVLNSLKEKGVNTEAIVEEVDAIMGQLETFTLEQLPKRLAPPKD